MKIPENSVFASFPTKDDDPISCEYSRVVVTWGGWCPGDLWLLSFVFVDVQDVGVVEVFVAFFLSGVVVTAEDDDCSTAEGC